VGAGSHRFFAVADGLVLEHGKLFQMTRAVAVTLSKRRVLVVDDDPAICSLTVRALERAGFECDIAADGLEALQKLALCRYEVLITDLRMPRMHGYALVNQLLSRANRPLILVVTEVVEPRLACHLIKRGADDFIFKPTDYSILAAKVEALLERRERGGDRVVADEPPLDDDALEPLNIADMQLELQRCTENAIVTPAALDVYLVSRGEQYSTRDAVTAISRDQQLVSAVLELGNTAFFNPSGRHVVSVEDAVMLLGQNRIGELILGMQLLSTISEKLPLWLNGDWLKKRSLSAAITADWFIRHGDHESIRTGILLGAIIHLLGRGLLASLYANRYQAALGQCREQQHSLVDLEQRLFPITPSSVLGALLIAAGVPKEDCEPLMHVAKPYSTLHELSPMLRRRTEVMKLSTFVGAIAAAEWMPWDSIELPPSSVGNSLGVNSLDAIIRIVQTGLTTRRDPRNKLIPQDRTRMAHGVAREISYCNLSSDALDCVRPLTSSFGITLKSCEPCRLKSTPAVLVNCCGATPGTVTTYLGNENWMDQLVLMNTEEAGTPQYRTLGFPCSCARLQELLQQATTGSLPTAKVNLPAHLSNDLGDYVHA